MKRTIFALLCLSIGLISTAQEPDSLRVASRVVELSISTPQPRLGEVFSISVDIHPLRANIFRSLMRNLRAAPDFGSSNHEFMTMEVEAPEKGKYEIGPLTFTLDNIKYTTNKVSYEVIDALPDTDEGLWLRAIKVSDDTFYIIIDQRIPAKSKTTYVDNSITITSEPEFEDIARFIDGFSIEGVRNSSSHSKTSFSSVVIGGEDRQFMYGYSVYRFEITDKSARIRITKDLFEKLPPSYHFEDIVIQ